MPKKILIVEDEANIRELLRLYLEREGYTVPRLKTASRALKNGSRTSRICCCSMS